MRATENDTKPDDGVRDLARCARDALERVCSGAGVDPASKYYAPDFVDHVNDLEFRGLEGTRQSVDLYKERPLRPRHLRPGPARRGRSGHLSLRGHGVEPRTRGPHQRGHDQPLPGRADRRRLVRDGHARNAPPARPVALDAGGPPAVAGVGHDSPVPRDITGPVRRAWSCRPGWTPLDVHLATEVL